MPLMRHLARGALTETWVWGHAGAMTQVFITVDSELSIGSLRRGADLAANLDGSIFGRTGEGDFGLPYQIERLNAHRLKAVFFVDPMPALLYGLDAVKPIVDVVLAGGHEVQLHVHAEWLAFADSPPIASRGPELHDYDEDDQFRLLTLARDYLVAAGAPPPVAFRAGNFGADDRTLRAVARLGLAFDSSFNASCLGALCRISLPAAQAEPVVHEGVVELPVSCIEELPGRLRHAQLCALSTWEMSRGLRHAVRDRHAAFTLVSHSFELLTRDRRRSNRKIVERFDQLCATLADLREVAPTAGYRDIGPDIARAAPKRRLPANPVRTAHRMGEQALSGLIYERAW